MAGEPDQLELVGVEGLDPRGACVGGACSRENEEGGRRDQHGLAE